MKLKNLLFLLIISIFAIGMYGCMAPTKTGEVAKPSAESKTETQQTKIKRTTESTDKYEPNNNIENAAVIEIGSEITGTIYPRGDKDFYKFSIDASIIKTVSIEMTNPGGGVIPVMRVHDPDGDISRIKPAKRGDNLTAEMTAKSGDYLVEISDQRLGQSSKPYVLKVTTEEKSKEERSSEEIDFKID